jgi:hypothetical protein
MMKNQTKVILYAQEGDQFTNIFKEMITKLVLEANMEIYGTISDFSSRLHAPHRKCDIAVLLAFDGEDLKKILSVQPLLDNARIILVLPDREPETVRMGHSLHPRYLGFKDNSFNDVKSVLARMLEVEQANKTTQSLGTAG